MEKPLVVSTAGFSDDEARAEDTPDPNASEAEGSPATLTWTESGFQAFFLENYTGVVALLMRIVGDRARAEELADDAFWKLYRQSLSTSREHNLAAWLFRTASRLGIDALRASSRRARYESAAATTDRTAPVTPLGSLLKSEKQTQVWSALARVRPAEAQILLLRSSGFSYKEIADSMDVKATSVGTLLIRAESAFEKAFRELFGADAT